MDIKPREYNQKKFRSTLEARWAIFFDELGWNWEYEPYKLENDDVVWEPDFVIKGHCGTIFCEVKPSSSPLEWFETERYCQALDYSSSSNTSLLLLGESPLPRGEYCDGAAVGWIVQPNTLQIEPEMFFNSSPIGICDEYSSWACKITGKYESQVLSVPWSKIQKMWIAAGVKADTLTICEPPEHPVASKKT